MHPDDKKKLIPFFPEQALDTVVGWIEEKKIHFRITRGRATKLGDYRPPIRHGNHRISVNHNLNKYAFLVTFVHEYAHLLNWEKHQRSVQPHGKEWKAFYRQLMTQIMATGAFPNDLSRVLEQSIINTKASSTTDIALARVLKQYDPGFKETVLEDIPEGSRFLISNGMVLKKGEKRRTRYKCLNMTNNRYYLVHALAPVIPENDVNTPEQ